MCLLQTPFSSAQLLKLRGLGTPAIAAPVLPVKAAWALPSPNTEKGLPKFLLHLAQDKVTLLGLKYLLSAWPTHRDVSSHSPVMSLGLESVNKHQQV